MWIKIKDLPQAEKDYLMLIVLKQLNQTIKQDFNSDSILNTGIIIKLIEKTITRLDSPVDVTGNEEEYLHENNQ